MPRTSSSPVMVGRDHELAALLEDLDRTRTRSARMAVITGEAGIGKTRLLQALAERAHRDDVAVLVGASAPYAYGPLVGILRELRRELGGPRLQRMLTGARRPLTRLVPGLEPGDVTDASEVTTQAPLLEATLDLVSTLADDAPLLLGMEDLHQADESTIDLVGFLAANLTTERVLVVTTCRTGGVHGERVGRFLPELVRHPSVTRLDLAPLPERDVTRLLAAIHDRRPTEESAVRIAKRSQGNPFYVEELLAAGDGDPDLPHGLEDLLLARLAGMSESTREVLRVAAVLGERPHDQLIHGIAELGDDDLRSGLEEAGDNDLLVPEGGASGRYRFRHDLIREVVHCRLLVDQRRRLHAAAARALEADPDLAEGGPDQVHVELARHWHLAGETDRAFTASLVASDEARRVHALSDALIHLRRALDLWDQVSDDVRGQAGDRYEIELRYAWLATLQADAQTGLEHMETALSMPDVPPEVRALLHVRAAYFLRGLARSSEAQAHTDRALELLPTEASAERAETLARAAGQRSFAGRHREAFELSERAIEAAQDVHDLVSESMGWNYRGCSLHGLGRDDEGIRDIERALSVARESGDPEEIKRAHMNLGEMLLRSGRFDEAVDAASDVLAWATSHGIGATNREIMILNGVDALVRCGRWREADEWLASVRSVSRKPTADATESLTVGMLRIGQGDLEAARRLLDGIPDEVIDDIGADLQAPLLATRVALAVADGRHDVVGDIVDRARAAGRLVLESEGVATYEVAGYLDPTLADGIRTEVDRTLDHGEDGDVARVEAARERAAGLLDSLREAVAAAQEDTHIRARLAASLALGEAELTRLDEHPDPDAWRDAVETATTTGMPYRVAYARYRLAEALLGADDRDAATEVLEEADRIAGDLGAEPLRRDIAVLARRGRLGLDAARRDEELGSDLTPREHDVLELLTEGHTNRQIGEGLYISEKTVERHVTSILSKLQADNRTEAAAVARRRELVGDGS